jgi:LysM repeat protein
MSLRELPNSGALSEFVSGYNGDCGECAELCLLHTLNPSAWPLDVAHLRTITGRDVARAWASASGAEPLNSIAHDLDLCGVHYTNDGYSEPASFDWRGALASVGGVRPLILELAVGGALPGDEPGLHYHFIACLGWDDAANQGVFADGDNARARGASGPAALVTYTLAELEAANVCGLLISNEAPPPPPPAPSPAPTGYRAYTVVSGDTLSGIAEKLHLGAGWYHTLYQPNMSEIEGAARAHGHPEGSHTGNLIWPGEVLHYQA